MKPVYAVLVAVAVAAAGGMLMATGFDGAPGYSTSAAGVDMPARQLAPGQKMITLQVSNMTCASCPIIVRRALEATPGVIAATVSYREKLAHVTYDSSRAQVATLAHAVSSLGYTARAVEPENSTVQTETSTQ